MPDNQKDVLFYEVITQLIEAQNQGKKLGNYVALDAAFKKHGADSQQEYDTLITDPNFEKNIREGTKEILDLAAQATHLFQKNQAQPLSPTTVATSDKAPPPKPPKDEYKRRQDSAAKIETNTPDNRPPKPSKQAYRARQEKKNAITRSSSATTITPPPPPKVSVQDRIKKWETMGNNKNHTR